MVSPVILRPAAWKNCLIACEKSVPAHKPGQSPLTWKEELLYSWQTWPTTTQPKCQAQKLTSVWESLVLNFHSFLPFLCCIRGFVVCSNSPISLAAPRLRRRRRSTHDSTGWSGRKSVARKSQRRWRRRGGSSSSRCARSVWCCNLHCFIWIWFNSSWLELSCV